MNRRLFLAAALAVLGLFSPRLALADDLKDMEGTWKVAEAEANGEKIESEELKAVVVKITGERYETTLKDGKDTGTLKLDAAQKPKTMDIKGTEGPNAGKVIKAIYELKDDTMKVCYTLAGEERPTELAAKSGTPFLLVTYKREKKTE